MSSTGENQSEERWAILIGIEFYMPGNAPSYRLNDLQACVKDVTNVEQYLLSALGVKSDHIFKLTATANPDDPGRPIEPATRWPTYANMVRVMKVMTNMANPGDLIYIHYSGHGARVPTDSPELKGQSGQDEALVPMDIRCVGRYLRDVEIATLLNDMTKKGLIVTIVLDNCYSGGCTRGSGGTAARGIENPDHDLLLIDKPDIPHERLDFARSSPMRGGWLFEPCGYELLAACQLNEKVYEKVYDDGELHGPLTYWLLKALKLGGPNITYGMLYRRIQALIRNDSSEKQTPFFAGNCERLFFSSKTVPYIRAIAIVKVEGGNVILSAGKAHGVSVGAKYEVYSWAHGLEDPDSRLGEVDVISVSELQSVARVTSSFVGISAELAPGCQAVLMENGTDKETLVKLLDNTAVDSVHRIAMLDQVRQMDLRTLNPGFCRLKLLSGKDKDAGAFHITVTSDQRYEILDNCCMPIPNLPNSNDAAVTLSHLIQLAGFQMLRHLKNSDRKSEPQGHFTFVAKPKDKAPLYSASEELIVRDGDTVTIRFRNRFIVPVNFVLFDFQTPLWGIKQLYPPHSDYETVEPNDIREFDIEMMVPEVLGSVPHVTDVLKAFITIQPTSFKALEMPDIIPESGVGVRSTLSNCHGDDLWQLLDKLVSTRRPSQRSSRGYWGTKQITIRTCSIP
ncbi:MAG: hypothetical protein M1813_009376 [Trichoglossum hirsutum]|nr:MAG: hypothetical protein M1813_009376 [Trichoglossum hirsutum]